MPSKRNRDHASTRGQLPAEAVFATDSPEDQARLDETRYRKVLDAYFSGKASSHDILLARVAMMKAWSRFVDSRAGAGLVRDWSIDRREVAV